MRFDHWDYPLLSTVNHLEIEKYLLSKKWKKLSTNPGRYSIWEHEDKERYECNILIPLNDLFEDYCRRMIELLTILEKVECRQQPDILNDIICMGLK